MPRAVIYHQVEDEDQLRLLLNDFAGSSTGCIAIGMHVDDQPTLVVECDNTLAALDSVRTRIVTLSPTAIETHVAYSEIVDPGVATLHADDRHETA